MKIIDPPIIELWFTISISISAQKNEFIIVGEINEVIKNRLSKLLFYINDAIIKIITVIIFSVK